MTPHAAVKDALENGTLIKGVCEVCGRTDVQGHHPDYSKPLDVRWLCRPHHMAEHARLRKAEPKKKVPNGLSYTIPEASALLGMSYTTLWRIVKAGDLKPIEGLATIRISRKELERFLGETEVK